MSGTAPLSADVVSPGPKLRPAVCGAQRQVKRSWRQFVATSIIAAIPDLHPRHKETYQGNTSR